MWKFLFIVLAAVVVLIGCTSDQTNKWLGKSEQAQKTVYVASTQPIAKDIEATIPYGELGGTILALIVGTWGAINVALRQHAVRTGQIAASPTIPNARGVENDPTAVAIAKDAHVPVSPAAKALEPKPVV